MTNLMECHAPSSPHVIPLLLLLLLLFFTPLTMAEQQGYPLPKVKGDKTIAIVLLVLIFLFFALGLLSIYTRRCSHRRHRSHLVNPAILPATYGGGDSHGLDMLVVESFPTFVYSDVKSHKNAPCPLECAVCLSEFHDEETLRLIPTCCHVFHPNCIEAWLSSHSTCPVCRANLMPKPRDTSSPSSSSSLVVNISNQPDPDSVISDDQNITTITDSKSHQEQRTLSNFGEENGSVRSFYRFNSTGHFTVRPVENVERFTLRLPEDMRNQLVNASSSVNRTVSCRVTFERERSEKEGYRTRSARRTEQFNGLSQMEQRGFTWTQPFIGMTRLERSNKGESNNNKEKEDEKDVGERSCDLLFPKDSTRSS
ncbi:hypothetical protein PIB30_054227 [Stylosanthes scabra]|uniref:RING-type E3 ubiquitin transferase n=1 Tax=Stylosanthes scabra TaxID=79078 RepID=A0ABU6VKR4_9FABA|nr:hypothetical protein [Stylosanthes scabra]